MESTPVLTDSDAAGFRIRNYITNLVGAENVVQAYVPAIPGKERRKAQPGKEGLLGVEGVEDDILLQCLRDALGPEAGEAPPRPAGRQSTYTDLYDWGLSGTAGSAERKRRLLTALGLPPRLSKKELVEALNRLYTYQQLDELQARLLAEESIKPPLGKQIPRGGFAFITSAILRLSVVLQPVHSACCEYGAAKGQDVLIEHDAGVVHGFAVEFILLAGPGTQQHRGVQIVAAAVHGAGVALERQTGLLLKGQSIHIGPEQNGLAGAAALDGGGQRAVGQLLRAIAILISFSIIKALVRGSCCPTSAF